MKIRKNAVTRSAILGASLISSLALLAAPAANAEVVVYAWDNGSDVSFDWGGSLNVSDLTATTGAGGTRRGIDPTYGTLNLMLGGINTPGYAATLSQPADALYADIGFFSFLAADAGAVFRDFTSFEQDQDIAFYADGQRSAVLVSSSYTSGTAISGRATIADASIASLLWFEGNYRYTMANSDYVEFRIGEAPAPVPVPPALGLMAAGLAGLVAKRRKA